MMSLRRSYEPKKPKDWLRLSQFLRVPVVRRKHQGRERIASWFFSWRPIEWNESIHLFFFFLFSYCFLLYSDRASEAIQSRVNLFLLCIIGCLVGECVCVCLRCGCTQATRQSQGCKTNPMKKERKKRPATREAWLTRRACATIEARAHNWIGELRKKKERPSSTPISTWNSFFFLSSSFDYNKKYKPAASFENDITTSFFNCPRLFFLLGSKKVNGRWR